MAKGRGIRQPSVQEMHYLNMPATFQQWLRDLIVPWDTVTLSLTTTDDTITVIYTLSPTNNSVTLVEAFVAGVDAGTDEYAGYRRAWLIQKDGASSPIARVLQSVTSVDSETVDDQFKYETTSSMAFETWQSGQDLLFRVTGIAATTIKWGGWLRFMEIKV